MTCVRSSEPPSRPAPRASGRREDNRSAEVDDLGVVGCVPAVILQVPLYEAADSDLDGRDRRVADVTLEVLDVGPGVGHVARLQRQHVHLRLATEALFENFDVAQQLDGAVVADVVQPVRRAAGYGIRRLAIPVRVRGSDPVAGTNN